MKADLLLYNTIFLFLEPEVIGSRARGVYISGTGVGLGFLWSLEKLDDKSRATVLYVLYYDCSCSVS